MPPLIIATCRLPSIGAISLVDEQHGEEVMVGIWPLVCQRTSQEIQQTAIETLAVQVKIHLPQPLICVCRRN